MLSFTGIEITKSFGSPSIRDMAVALMREPRFGGANSRSGAAGMYPVGLHTMVVADLLVAQGHKRLEADGLLHDGAESAGLRDVCRPMKTEEGRELEELKLRAIYRSFGRKFPSPEDWSLIHSADMATVNAEGALGLGPRGYSDTQPDSRASKVVMGLVRNYLDGLEFTDFLNPDGKWPLRWESRVRRALRDSRATNTQYTERGKG